jgi:hypothetical protein
MLSTAFYTTYLQVVPCKRIATRRRSTQPLLKDFAATPVLAALEVAAFLISANQ